MATRKSIRQTDVRGCLRIGQDDLRQREGMHGADEYPGAACDAEGVEPVAQFTGALVVVGYAGDPARFLTSSASMRASLIVSVFVLPLPGPARTTQWPVDL